MNTLLSDRSKWGLAALMAALFALSLGWFVNMNYQVGMRAWDLWSSALLLAVPLALLYFSLGIFILAWEQKRSRGAISDGLAKLIYYTPRIAGVLIILFVTMFSLDVFAEGGNPWEMAGAFLMHSLPSIVLAIVLAVAWRRPVVGFWVFLLAALFFMHSLLTGRLMDGLGQFLVFSGPMLMIALLFWANWKWRITTGAGRQRAALPQA